MMTDERLDELERQAALSGARELWELTCEVRRVRVAEASWRAAAEAWRDVALHATQEGAVR